MILLLLLYLLFASTFTLGKAVLFYISPVLFIGIRMVVAGLFLLIFQYLFRRAQWKFEWRDIGLLFNVALFLIFISFVSEFWALQYVSAAKACLLFNMSPFITALLAYIFFNSRLTMRQWIGLGIGFLGFIPILVNQGNSEVFEWHLWFLSSAEILLLVAVISSCYGWIVMRQLIMERGYSPVMINGISMLIGGGMALVSSGLIEAAPRIHIVDSLAHTLSMVGLYTGALIIIANIVCFNLYGFLLQRYSPTFISFAGFTTPVFTAFFDFIIWHERVPLAFYLTLGFVIVGLLIFYQDELTSEIK